MAEVEQQLSIADLLAVLPDNTRRLIRPVHWRDIVETFRVGHGQIYLTATATTVVGSAGVYYKLLGTTALSATPPARNFSMPASNRLQYDGPAPRLAEVYAHFSVDVGTLNQLLRFQFSHNGTLDTETQHQRWFEPVADVGSLTMKAHMLLQPGDYVELWGSNQTSPGNFTIDTLTMSVIAHAY
jgi:hypothetical protein